MFFINLAYLALFATWLPRPTDARLRPDPTPRRMLASVSVVDTPIVRAAQQFARQHSDDKLYNHVMRAWLFGTTFRTMANGYSGLRARHYAPVTRGEIDIFT